MNDFRTASLQAWTNVATAWDELAEEVDRQLARATEWMLGAVALAPGDRVLELAAGPGTLTSDVARQLRGRGRIVCSDFSQAMVDIARRRLASAEVDVDVRVLDAEALDLPDETIDVVLCRCGYMLMTDPAAALAESARVLAHSGRLALAVWGDAAANPWAALPMRAVSQAVGAPPPPAGAPGLWSLSDTARLEQLLADAGFEATRVEVLDATVEYASTPDWLDRVGRLAGPLRAMLAAADAATRARIVDDLERTAAEHMQPDGRLRLPQRFVVAAAVKR